MNLEDFKNRTLTLVIILAVSILLLLLDSVGVVSSLYDLTSVASVPARLEFRRVSLKLNDVLGIITQISTFKKENEELKRENLDLLSNLSELEEKRVENEILKEQLKLGEVGDDQWMLQARIIGSNVTYDNTLQISVGSCEGVEEGDVVVFGEYAVGVIKRVEKYSSKVLLIMSVSSNIPVRGQTNRAIGLIQGSVGLTLNMVDILPDEVIEDGEIVVTSGVDSEFPAGFIIGVVSNVDNNPANATQEAHVDVQIDFTKLDYIYVIKGQNK